MTSAFGDWLVRARGAAGLTQQQLSEQTGVHINTIKKIEAGTTTRVSAGVAAKLRGFLNEEVDPDLVRDEYDRHTRAALDLIGAYLMRIEEGERLSHIFAITNFVLRGSQE